jgi:hypothetical protein
MATVEIPAPWRRDVCAILVTERSGTLIEWTDDARNRYEADSSFAWEYEVYAALKTFLSSSRPTGCLVAMAKPAGETYEFYFEFKGIQFYGKILLRTDRKRVVLFSAHLPLKPKLSCE